VGGVSGRVGAGQMLI
jgi:uncharacterized protein CbrC (UPF0167 family)